MARILVTGMSGTGKSTLLHELARRGRTTLDTDDDGWVLPTGLWDAPRMSRFLAEQPDVVVSGTVENQGRFYDRFDHVVLLTAPIDVLLARVRSRTNNPYGSSAEDRAAIRQNLVEVEPLLRLGAGLELDGRMPTSELADVVESLLAAAAGAAPEVRDGAAR